MRTAAIRLGLLAFALVAGCAPAHVITTPAPRPVAGDYVRYSGGADPGDFVTVRLVSLDADSLVYSRFIPGERPYWATGSLPTAAIDRLQVRVGRRGNAVRGGIIGGVVGVGLGLLCVTGNNEWVITDEACFLGYTLFGAGTGLLVGALRRSDVWAPYELPAPHVPPVTSGPAGRPRLRVGLRVPAP